MCGSPGRQIVIGLAAIAFREEPHMAVDWGNGSQALELSTPRWSGNLSPNGVTIDCQLFGSILIRSFTAERIRCLQPRYRSVVWIETWPSRNCICSSSPPAAWHSLAQVRRRSCGASLSMAVFAANSRTTCQTTFSVMLSPQTLPALFTRRNRAGRSSAVAACSLPERRFPEC